MKSSIRILHGIASRYHLLHNIKQRAYSSFKVSSVVVDLRSDTVTAPSRPMLEAALYAKTGDDVMGEDPTVLELQDHVAKLFGKQEGLFVPTGTMRCVDAVFGREIPTPRSYCTCE